MCFGQPRVVSCVVRRVSCDVCLLRRVQATCVFDGDDDSSGWVAGIVGGKSCVKGDTASDMCLLDYGDDASSE